MSAVPFIRERDDSFDSTTSSGIQVEEMQNNERTERICCLSFPIIGIILGAIGTVIIGTYIILDILKKIDPISSIILEVVGPTLLVLSIISCIIEERTYIRR